MRNSGWYKLIVAILFVFMSIPLSVGHAAEGGEHPNLLLNPGFEETESGVPSSWTQDVWVQGSEVTRFTVDTLNTHSGGTAAVIENTQPNHAKWVQKIKVDPNTYYRINGWVNVAGTDENATGANLLIIGVGGEFPQIHNTAGEWKLIEFYGKTSKGQKEIQLAASLGGYGSLNTGRAWFDDLALTQVDKLPAGVTAISFAPSDVSGGDAAKADSPPKVSAFPVLAISTLFAMLFVYLYSRMLRQRLPLEHATASRSAQIMAWLLIALGFRIVIAVGYTGYESDLRTFIFWGNEAYNKGITGFYQEGVFADYPPGYIYVLYVLGMLQQLFGLDGASKGAYLLYKLPAIIADLAAGWVIYKAAGKKLGETAAFGLAMLYLWNPAVWVDSAAWGQVDSIFTLFLLLAVQAVVGNKLERGALWFAIAVLVKPQALIFTPIILLAIAHKREWTRTALSAVYGLALFVALAIPFFWSNGGLSGLISLYKTTLASYPYATLNVFNLYALTGGNWTDLDHTFLFIPYSTWGIIAILLAVALSVFLSVNAKHKSDLSKSYYIGLILISVMFLLGTKMHERYLFPAILLGVFAYIEAKDRRILHILLGYSITFFINVGYVLAFSKFTTNVPTDGIVIVTSIANLGLLLYMLYVGYDIYIRGRVQSVPSLAEDEQARNDEKLLSEIVNVQRSDKSPSRLKKNDWIAMLVITLIYAVVALSNLGSTQTLGSGWTPAKSGQSFYVDLGEARQLERMNSFGGYGEGKYKLEFSNTPDAWSNPMDLEQKGGDDLKWAVHPLNITARYVKVTTNQTGYSIQEMAFYAKGSEEPLAISQVVEEEKMEGKSSAVRLFDEQSAAAYKASYKNGSYFDEIYHARTALENIEGVRAYENTHPPLGKIIIALGIKLFGLSPFGWRIMGTLFGIAMVPILYLFALRLFKRTGYAAAAAGLLAAEFMHFTQTRIATIDVYGVFFIMLMFYFMYKYYSLNFYSTPLRKTLVPLFWAGLLFGIGVASKWIVIYGGAGLAIMLALSLFERYRQYGAAKRILAAGKVKAEEEDTYRKIIRLFPRNTVITLAICLIFYVAIPAVIYGLSYIPVLKVAGDEYTAERLVDYQKNMYHYHSELVATHPYSSQWWEWPFMKRPVWYYSGSDLANPGNVSTISAFGNPLIWWTGIFALLGTLYFSIKRKDKRVYIIWIAYLSQYLPWMLVPRLTFIYHYFAMVPFMILAIIYMFKLYEEKRPDQQWLRWLYVAVAAVLFLLYYPVLSGMEVARAYAAVIRIFDSWVFYG
ncbi:phospholipid carrier-dependent glycosyltransferase [Paenibacillus gorillae]|uniref:phospholipid carrier-dependent glycosyltransferase n=1 Tax=Paenibacillus gorillae TaxID=1243662 RepID=UPI0004B82FEE|nr:phospholipid carrier-dependent glycosyltransferase [Paenibacillus gorillae]